MVKFNINDYIYVEIKKNTFDIIKNKIPGNDVFKDTYMRDCITPFIYDINGIRYIKLQMWAAMNYFGNEMEMGREIPIGTNILIDESDCEKIN